MGRSATDARRRLSAAGLLAVLSLTTTWTASAATAPAPGSASLTDIRVGESGITAIMTARATGGAPISPASVQATIAGVRAPVSVKPVVQARRVTTLLIDTSGSMGIAGMATVVRASNAFLASVPPEVYVGVVAFSTVPRVVASPTLNRASVRSAVAGLRSQGETSLYDGLVVALDQLGTAGDRSFILLSDGGDTRSRHTLAQTSKLLSASGVRAKAVGFKTTETQGSVLRNLASAGHGSVVAAADSAAVSAAFMVAAQALESQISVFIASPRAAGGIKFLEVTASAGGKLLSGRTPVNLSVRAAAPASSAAAATGAPASEVRSPSRAAAAPGPEGPEGSGGAWMLSLALLTVFLGLAGVVGILASPTFVSRRQKRADAFEAYFNGSASSPADERSAVTSISASLVNLGDKVMDSRASTPKTQRLLERADLPLRPGEWAVLRVIAVVVGVAGGTVLLHGGSLSTFFGICLGGLVGAIGPSLFLKLAASRRSRKFEGQLPDVLTLVASSLSTGFSLLQALDAVARDAAQPSAKEFARALAETRIGADLNDSLDHLADRMESTNLRWTNMAIDIQRQVGGNLGETLRSTAATLRDREALSRHVKALSAEGKLSAYILIALPVGVFGFMLVGNRAYVELLWTTLIGIGMLVAALISMGIGVLWMNKVVKVEI